MLHFQVSGTYLLYVFIMGGIKENKEENKKREIEYFTIVWNGGRVDKRK